MNAIQKLERLKRINELIIAEGTGSPAEFSRKHGISRSQLRRDIEYLKDLGAKISYSKLRETYYYRNKPILKISLNVQIINKAGTQTIYGGFFQNKRLSALF
jgi:predicted DNA-binding transcriptional regulator YafY